MERLSKTRITNAPQPLTNNKQTKPMYNPTLTELAQEAYYIAQRNGFYAANQRTNLLREKMLILTEIAEAINAERCGRYSRKKTISTLWPPAIYEWRYKRTICGTVEDELADAMLRVLTLHWHYFSDTPVFQEDIATPLNLPELMHYSARFLTDHQDIGHQLSVVYTLIRKYAYTKGIDIPFVIRRKNRYNQLRGYLHGKQY